MDFDDVEHLPYAHFARLAEERGWAPECIERVAVGISPTAAGPTVELALRLRDDNEAIDTAYRATIRRQTTGSR